MANEDSDFSVQIRKTRLGGLARRVVDQSIMDREAALNHLALAHDNGVSFLTQATQAMPDKKAMLYRMTAEEYGMPLFDLRTLNLTDRPADLVTPKFIDEHQVLPIFHRGSKVFVAVSEPGEQAGLDAFKFQTGLGVEPILVDATALQESIERIRGEASASDLAVLDDDNLEDIEFVDEDESAGETVSQADAESDTPVVRFVNKL
ncbi:uncharacterized protein METZ01_LOCUS480764, partial [marine metagenome]